MSFFPINGKSLTHFYPLPDLPLFSFTQVLTKAAKKYVPNTYTPGHHRSGHDGPHLHLKGSCVTIEGPRFSSRCESKLFHQWGIDVINMTNVPEVILAKEAGLSYAALAIVTDYDAWHESHEAVSLVFYFLPIYPGWY